MISWPPYTIWLRTPKGVVRVLFMIDRGPDSDTEWNCITETGEVWAFLNNEIRVAVNLTYGIKDEDHRNP